MSVVVWDVSIVWSKSQAVCAHLWVADLQQLRWEFAKNQASDRLENFLNEQNAKCISLQLRVV